MDFNIRKLGLYAVTIMAVMYFVLGDMVRPVELLQVGLISAVVIHLALNYMKLSESYTTEADAESATARQLAVQRKYKNRQS